MITGKTAVYGILGYPVCHSLSPVMQNSAFQAAGFDNVYVPFEVRPEMLGSVVAGLKAAGVCGWNVTIPHKTSIMPFMDLLDDSALQAGAVNVVKCCDGMLKGFNTDGAGLVKALKVDLDLNPEGAKVVLAGAGGAARGAAAGLCAAGATMVTVVNRNLDAARVLVDDLASYFPEVVFSISPIEKDAVLALGKADLIVNATSVGMKGDKLAWLDLDLAKKGAKVYDMVYSPLVTPLIEAANRLGLPAANGLGMLAGQGELAFRIWTGKDPGQGVMRQALERHLALPLA